MSDWNEIAAQIHAFPWSAGNFAETKNIESREVVFQFFGTPVLSISSTASAVLPRRYEKFKALGPEYPPRDKTARLFEAPHVVVAGFATGCLIEILHQGIKHQVKLVAREAVEKYSNKEYAAGKHADSDLALTVLSWAQAFDGLLDLGQKNLAQPGRIPWETVINYIEMHSRETGKPQRPLIFAIAERLHAVLPATVAAMRKMLNRERRLMPIARISEMDAACLHHYTRLPGLTVAEKAGPWQQLLGISRFESYNLHENRILKDFLWRCSQESTRYLQTQVNGVAQGGATADTVNRFGALCRSLRRDPFFEEVTPPEPGSLPNYTLLNDPRYKEIWRWYRRLLRREDDEDSLWDWQSRTWADIVRLLVCAAIVKLSWGDQARLKVEKIANSSLRIRRFQLQGSRIWAGAEPGPFLIKKVNGGKIENMAVLELVNSEHANAHPIARMLGQTGGHLYLVVQPLKGEKRKKVIIVWALNQAGAVSQLKLEEIARSARKGLNIHFSSLGLLRLENLPTHIDGLVVCSALSSHSTDAVFADENLATVLSVPARPDGWKESLDWISAPLEELLGSML